MPVKNAALFLDECIESIISQSYSKLGISLLLMIIQADDTLQILKRFSALDSRITVLNNHRNGIIEALKTGYNVSKGELITRMDADDIMPKIKLEKLQQLLITSGKRDLLQVALLNTSQKNLWAMAILNMSNG